MVNISTSPNQNKVLLQSTAQQAHCAQLYDGNDDIPDGKIPLAYNTMTMQPCNQYSPLQQFQYDPKTQYISSIINTSLCLTAMKPNCTVKPFNTYPFCDQQLPSKQRAVDLVSRMTLYEKILGLNYYNPLFSSNLYINSLCSNVCQRVF